MVPLGRPELFVIRDGTTGDTTADDGVLEQVTYHVVGTYDGARLAIYVDGLLESDDATDIPMLASHIGDFIIGSDGDKDLFNGTIDEVAVYDRALTPSQVATHYNVGSTEP